MLDSSSNLGALGFSLKPPKWARDAVANLVKKVDVKTTVSSPAGPVTVNPLDPATLSKAAEALRNARVTINPQPAGTPTPTDPGAFVESQVPGGWLTLAAAGAGLFALVAMSKRRGR